MIPHYSPGYQLISFIYHPKEWQFPFTKMYASLFFCGLKTYTSVWETETGRRKQTAILTHNFFLAALYFHNNIQDPTEHLFCFSVGDIPPESFRTGQPLAETLLDRPNLFWLQADTHSRLTVSHVGIFISHSLMPTHFR